MSKYSNLVEEIDKQEEVKEQKANLDNELQLLKQTIKIGRASCRERG